MKHLKYPHNKTIEKNAHRKRIALFNRRDKRHYCLRSFLNYCNVILMVALMGVLIFLCFYLGNLESISKGWRTFLTIILALSTIVVPIPIGIALFICIDKALPNIPLPQLNRRIVYDCVTPLKKYYHISNDYIVTKCYQSSVDELTNKDLLLFIYNDELRIVNDFTTTVKDFGCYVFPKDELECFYEQNGDGRTTTVVKCKDMTLILGKRAKPFVANNLFIG